MPQQLQQKIPGRMAETQLQAPAIIGLQTGASRPAQTQRQPKKIQPLSATQLLNDFIPAQPQKDFIDYQQWDKAQGAQKKKKQQQIKQPATFITKTGLQTLQPPAQTQRLRREFQELEASYTGTPVQLRKQIISYSYLNDILNVIHGFLFGTDTTDMHNLEEAKILLSRFSDILENPNQPTLSQKQKQDLYNRYNNYMNKVDFIDKIQEKQLQKKRSKNPQARQSISQQIRQLKKSVPLFRPDNVPKQPGTGIQQKTTDTTIFSNFRNIFSRKPTQP